MSRIQGKCVTAGCNNLQKAVRRVGGKPFYARVCRRCRDKNRKIRNKIKKRERTNQGTGSEEKESKANTEV